VKRRRGTVLCRTCAGAGAIEIQPSWRARDPQALITRTCPTCYGEMYVTRRQAERLGWPTEKAA
jgi:DnaJ-class molecular chaperone